jgi:hypothetical protein
MNSTIFKQNDLEVSSTSSIRKDSDRDATAIKVQKVYTSYQTRWNLAGCDVLTEELWFISTLYSLGCLSIFFLATIGS